MTTAIYKAVLTDTPRADVYVDGSGIRYNGYSVYYPNKEHPDATWIVEDDRIYGESIESDIRYPDIFPMCFAILIAIKRSKNNLNIYVPSMLLYTALTTYDVIILEITHKIIRYIIYLCKGKNISISYLDDPTNKHQIVARTLAVNSSHTDETPGAELCQNDIVHLESRPRIYERRPNIDYDNKC